MKSNLDIRKTSRRFNDKRRAALAVVSYDNLMNKDKNIEKLETIEKCKTAV